MHKITIQDIAKAANVSKSTVSRVLNGSAAVTPEKKRAVLEASERLGFSPNVVARSLARGRSMTIGVLTQLIGSPFFDTIAQGVIAALYKTEYSPVFVDGQWQQDAEVEAIRALLGRQVDGLILIGGSVPEQQIDRLCGNLPTVVVARQLNGTHHRCVYMDNVEGGRLATQHLIEHGHRDIAIIRGLPHHADSRDRYAGYQKALQLAEIDEQPHLVLDGDFSAESGERCVNQLISEGHRFTAVFACNDMMAFGAQLALYRHRLKVPDDVSVIGYDDQMESAYTTPPLTTIRQPAREMGQLAAENLLRLIERQAVESTATHGTLVQRETVAPPGHRSSADHR